MSIEIERKFLVLDERWRDEEAVAQRFRQFYLSRTDGFSLRIRIVDETFAFLTMKTGRGLSRGEFEYPIPLADARDLEAARLGEVIAKRRYRIAHGSHVVEVDVFADALEPLVVAEVELRSEDDAFDPPPWLGEEITGNPAYSNAALAASGLPQEFSRR